MTDAPCPPTPRPFEQARLEIARLGTPAEPLHLPDVFRRVCEISAAAMTVERVGIWLLVEHGTALRCASLYERSTCEHTHGVTLRVADFPKYFAALRDRRAVPIEMAASDPRAAELYDPYLKPLGIGSLLDAPVLLAGEVVGVVCHEYVGAAREWTTEERDFAGSVADLVALKMKGAELTELRAALRTHEARLFAYDKADALAHLAVGVAHDFRNLLTVMGGGADLIAAHPAAPPQVVGWAKEVGAAAERGAVLVRELLEFGRANGAAPRVVDPAAVVEKFAPVLRAVLGSRYQLELTRADKVGKALVDPNHLDRVLLNLVTNAKDAMPGGGTVRVRVAPVTTAEADEGPDEPYVLVEVRDAGGGIDDATRERLFEPFFTTKPKGTGMGLAIVKQVVDAAGGFIRVESAAGTGTAILVYLPRVTGEG
jgi:two-component system cell cycle sensor histidine kinase/response regulator CckA